MNFVLSIFPGIDLLGRAFELEGFCIVRGPDILWGGNIKDFHPPSGVFVGVIGGPPCPFFSRLRYLNPNCGKKEGNLIPEFCRVVSEAAPTWWMMENVRESPEPAIEGYHSYSFLLNTRWLGDIQERTRRITFGCIVPVKLDLEVALFEHILSELAVTSHASAIPVKLGGSRKVKSSLKPTAVMAGHGPYDRREGTPQYPKRSIEDMCILQGLPSDFTDNMPFRAEAKRRLIGNGVPMAMGRALARAVKKGAPEFTRGD